jgi:GNAT superfamily N-acetyltransferase
VQWEPLTRIVKELLPLIMAQNAESTTPGQDFAPDWDRYFEYERAGILKIWTARDAANGLLVGYVVTLVAHGLHASTQRFAHVTILWLAPEWRNGLLGLRFLRSFLRACKKLGVQLVRIETNDAFEPDGQRRSRVGKILARLGLSPISTVYQGALK